MIAQKCFKTNLELLAFMMSHLWALNSFTLYIFRSQRFTQMSAPS